MPIVIEAFRGVLGVLLIVVAFNGLSAVAGADDPTPGLDRGDGGCSKVDAPLRELSPNQARKALICSINVARADAGLRRVSRDRQLDRAAAKHTKAMLAADCFAHKCPGEPNLDKRVKSSGYLKGATRWQYGETIACATTATETVDQWLKNPDHRLVLQTKKYKDLGLGYDDAAPDPCTGSFSAVTGVFGFRRG